MTNTLTPDGAIFLSALAIAALCVLLYILLKARLNNGVAILPDGLMFGWWGAAWAPSVLLIARSQAGNAALLAHEQCHQMQQRRDGWLTFFWRYLTNKRARLDYEIEAYRVWVQHSPDDLWRVVGMLQGYGVELTYAEALALLDAP